MEKISAACAMEWSIELEKGLRSKKPGRRVEVIEQIGCKLQQWSTESDITMAISDMYGLVPGEDRIFANTILLRLADAFRYGDNYTRGCILKAFIVESKHLKKKGKGYNGILAKRRVPNYVELLKRVKVVFDTGDAEAKGLALRLFGCWADLAKDSSQIRYMILLSLQSSHVSEVKASLFAAGCFCRLSEDFACIVLEILTDIISSLQASSDVKFEAIHAFSDMRCSSSIASRAYKAGKNLMLSLQQDNFKAEMLSSLSKLTLNSSLLIPEQVDLLLSFLSRESASLVKAKALKCLYFLFCGGASHFHVNRNVLTTLLDIIEDNELSPHFHCGALRILRKIFCSIHLPYVDMSDIFKLVLIAENAAQSSVKAKKGLVLSLVVDSLCSLKNAMRAHWCLAPEKWHAPFFQFQGSPQAIALASGRGGPTLLVCHVTLLIIDHLKSLMKKIIVVSGGKHIFVENLISIGAVPERKLEFKSSLNLILHLAGEYPSSARIALDSIRCLIQTMVGMLGSVDIKTTGTHGEVSQIELGAESHNPILRPHESYNKEEISFVSELILCTCRFTNAYLDILDETGAVNTEVCHIVKILVECIQQSGSFTCDMYETFCLQMRAYVLSKSYEVINNSAQDLNESKVGAEIGFSHSVCWVAQEWQALEFAKKMLKRRNYWAAYRVGKYSCCEAAWFAATFTFRKLIGDVKSDLYRCWVISLMLLAGGESEIKLLLFPNVGVEMINGMQTENDIGKPFSCVEAEMSQYGVKDGDLRGCEGKLVRVYSRICSSEEILEAARASDGVYYFQRWFLSLRAKVLEILVDIVRLLDTHTFTGKRLNKGFEGDGKVHFTAVSQTMHALASGFARISFRLSNLAKGYDLLAISFLDIDSRSYRSISKTALSCSVLAFCTAFVLYFINSPAYRNVVSFSLSNMGEISDNVIIKDLVERLWDIDSNTTRELQQFMTVSGEIMNNLLSRTQINSSGLTDRASLLVYKFAIMGVLRIQEDSKGVKDEEGLCALFVRGMQLQSEIIRKWMEIPVPTPKYFFRVRPCIGAELFIFNADAKSTDGLSIPPGFQLSLNLCIQLKNASRKLRVRAAKFYCILAVRPSDRLTIGGGERERGTQCGFHARKTDEMVELNEVLLGYIRTHTNNTTRKHCDVNNGGGLVTTFVCFEPNDKGQGFSTCLVDVSALPEGLYPIKWHCCCIDKNGLHWNLLPMNPGSIFTIRKS